MAITSGLWTLNALSVELGIRYRTLGKKLSDLKPDEEERQAGRVVRRWRLARVLKHLKAAGGNGIESDRPAGVSYRAAKEKYVALLKQLEYERVSAELIPAEEVVGAWQQLVAAFQAKCLALPSKLAPRLATMNDSRAVQAALTSAVREALEELSHYRLPRRARGNGRSTAEPGGPRRPRTAVH
ncbi:MAG: hypothetical protein ACREXW_11395 [Gammaproteobacteria bacterium]